MSLFFKFICRMDLLTFGDQNIYSKTGIFFVFTAFFAPWEVILDFDSDSC